jgi:multiphosphoryl transfer protein
MGLTRRLVVANASGLHARPAARFVEEARRFESELVAEHGEHRASCKSLIALMRLGAGAGSTIVLHAEGHDAEAALDRLEELLQALAAEEPSCA